MRLIDDVKEAVRKDGTVKIALLVGAALIIAVMFLDFNGKSNKSDGGDIYEKYREKITEELTATLNAISGVSGATVLITLDDSKEYPPRIRGAAVVCKGGGDAEVKLAVVETVSKALGILTSHVSVAPK